MVEDARAKGYTETMLGRRRGLPALAQADGLARANAERAAINTPIQGSAADLLKVAMVRLSRNLLDQRLDARLLLTVHDEILLDCAEKEVARAQKAVVEAMTRAMDLDVPLEVKVGAGDNWFEVHS
jgi:DNA polymerase-1